MSGLDTDALASLSLTHVHYNPNDPLSYLCAWLALVPQGLCVVYATLIWSTREVEIMMMFAGQMACEALNWGLKRWIKEERPRRMAGKGYGMPSSHAQFVAYFAATLALFLLLRHQPRPSPSPTHLTQPSRVSAPKSKTSSQNNHPPLSWGLRATFAGLALLGAVAVAVSRVYLRYHTPKQVAVGCAAGLACAVGWFAFTGWLRRMGVVDALLESEVVRLFRVRDLVVTEDLSEAGWERWEGRRLERRRERERERELDGFYQEKKTRAEAKSQ
ncbi:MAG: hypothetical protein M1816_004134 [Peltula sp. TS41687]|nr:MAG: hypothetical protein M1816_004134 [Peltula sp. TS41687]